MGEEEVMGTGRGVTGTGGLGGGESDPDAVVGQQGDEYSFLLWIPLC